VHRHFRQTIQSREYRHVSNTVELESLAITSAFEGAEREVHLEADGKNYLVVFWSTGVTEYHAAGQHLNPGPGEGLVMTPDTESRTRATSGNQYLTVLSIPAGILQQQAEKMLGRPLPGPLENRGLLRRASSYLWQTTRHLLDQLERGLFEDLPLSAPDLEYLLIKLVIEEGLSTGPAVPFIKTRYPSLARRHVWQAKEYGYAHPRATPADMAHAAGVSLRTLEIAFGVIDGDKTPSRWLLEMRLDRAHHDLEHRPGASVRSVAQEYGLSLTHFAKPYQTRFGEPPGATLLRNPSSR